MKSFFLVSIVFPEKCKSVLLCRVVWIAAVQVMQQTGAFDCHCNDFLLNKDAADHSCVSEMNAVVLFSVSHHPLSS